MILPQVLKGALSPFMSRILKAGFIMTNVLGHKSHAMNLVELAGKRDDIECHFAHVPQGGHKLSSLPAIRNDAVLQAGIEGRDHLARFVNTVDIAFMHTETTAHFSSDLMKRIPTIISLDATQKQWFDLNAQFFSVPEQYSVTERIKMAVMKKSRLKHRLYQQVMNNAVHIVAWSEWNKSAIVEEYGVKPEDVSVIAPGVNVRRFRPGQNRSVEKGATVRILFVGGDFRRKGGDLLLRWARETNAMVPWEMHIVTREPVTDCPPGVRIYNDVQNNSDTIVGLFENADIFALPTRADCLPVVLLEAMASGLPIVASDVAAIPEVVLDGETGLVFEKDNYEQFQNQLTTLVNDASLRTKMGHHAREIALEKWSIEVNYGALLDLVKRIGSSAV